MNFGKCDRQLLLQRPAAAAQNSFGAPAPAAFSDVETVWGEQKPGAGSEAVQAAQLTAQQVVVWQIRYRADVVPTWQLVCEGRTYQITAVQEIGRRQGLTLTTYYRG